MKNIVAIAVVYGSLMAVIGFAIYVTKSALPLWALIFTPSIKMGD